MNTIEFFSYFALFMLTVITPGPDFLIVTRTSLQSGVKAGIRCALGIGTGLIVHNLYCVLGVALMIHETPSLFNILKVLGALYLAYLGVMMLKSKGGTFAENPVEKKNSRPFRSGLLINLLNVKAMVWILTFYTSILPESVTFGGRTLFGISVIFGATIFFIFLAAAVSRPFIIKPLRKAGPVLDPLLGLAFLFFAGKMVFDLF